MPETLLSSSAVIMYGRSMDDITINQAAYPAQLGANDFLYDQLEDSDSRLAKIYAVSYEGYFYFLSAPVIFLVHGDGVQIDDRDIPATGRRNLPALSAEGADITGVAAVDYLYSGDMRAWTYDKNDISLRLDVSTGRIEDILLDAEVGEDAEPVLGGGRVGGGRVGGGRVGGGRVGGGRVGGGRVGGGRVGGGRVGGGRVGG